MQTTTESLRTMSMGSSSSGAVEMGVDTWLASSTVSPVSVTSSFSTSMATSVSVSSSPASSCSSSTLIESRAKERADKEFRRIVAS